MERQTPEGPRLEQKYIFAEPMEMRLEVFQVKTPPRSQVPVHIITMNAKRKHETKVAACTRGGLKGLYCFRLTGTELESFIRTTGTYIFIFTLVCDLPYNSVSLFMNLYTNVILGPSNSR